MYRVPNNLAAEVREGRDTPAGLEEELANTRLELAQLRSAHQLLSSTLDESRCTTTSASWNRGASRRTSSLSSHLVAIKLGLMKEGLRA